MLKTTTAVMVAADDRRRRHRAVRADHPGRRQSAGQAAAAAPMTACAQRAWPYLRCVGTQFGNPHIRLVSHRPAQLAARPAGALGSPSGTSKIPQGGRHAPARARGFALLLARRLAFAQSYPDHPIRIIVPTPAGGPVDVMARLIAAALPASSARRLRREQAGRRQYARLRDRGRRRARRLHADGVGGERTDHEPDDLQTPATTRRALRRSR